MSFNLLTIVVILITTHVSNSEFLQCINKTHDNTYKPYNETNQYWHDTMNKMYSKSACSTWRSIATILTSNTMLTLSGFASSGVSSGSIAAVIQSYFGNVAAGSFFSSLQSLGAIGGVSMFGPVAFGTFIGWSAICGDFIDININFMNEKATQCFQNEKILYMSLEQAEQIINLAKEYEVSSNLKHKVEGIVYETGKKTKDMFEWVSASTMALDAKYEIKETIKDTTSNAVKYSKERINRFVYDTIGYFGIF